MVTCAAMKRLRLRGRNRPGEKQPGTQESQKSRHNGIPSNYIADWNAGE